MKPSDLKFDVCLFELHDLMRAKGDVGTISNIVMETIIIHKLAHCHGHKYYESLNYVMIICMLIMMLSMAIMMRTKIWTSNMRRL